MVFPNAHFSITSGLLLSDGSYQLPVFWIIHNSDVNCSFNVWVNHLENAGWKKKKFYKIQWIKFRKRQVKTLTV